MDDPLKTSRRRALWSFLLAVGLLTFAASGAHAQTPPAITTVSPSTGSTGTEVTITGTDFGSSQGASTVTFAGVPAIPTSWSSTEIVTPVPGSAIAFADVEAALTRDGGYFDPTQDFTIAFWLKLTSHVGPNAWRTLYVIGDAQTYTNPYIWIGTGSGAGPDTVVKFEAYNGTGLIDVVTDPLTPDEWHYLVFTHDAGIDALTGYVDGELIDSLNLAMAAFVEDDEYIANDSGFGASGLQVAYFRNWQAELDASERDAEEISVVAVRSTNLLSSSRLSGNGDIADSSGQSRHWSTVGSPGTARGPLTQGSAVEFPASKYLTRNASFFDATQNFSIGFWYRLSSPLSSARELYSHGDVTNWINPYVWIGTAGGDLYFGIWDGTNWFEIYTPITDGKWHYAALTYTSSTDTFTAYLDGAVVDTTTGTLGTYVEKDDFLANSTNGVGSAIAHVRQWQATLNSGELASEMASPAAVRTTNLLSDTPLSGVIDLLDRSGSSRHWTAHGAPRSTIGPLLGGVGPVVVTVNALASNAAPFGSAPVLDLDIPDGDTVEDYSVVYSGSITGLLTDVTGVTCNGSAAVIDGTNFYCVILLTAGENDVDLVFTERSGVVSTVTKVVTFAPQVIYKYDALGRLIQVTDQAGDTAFYEYDAVGNVLAITRHDSGEVLIAPLPASAAIGSTFTINGTGFSPLPSSNTVEVNGVAMTVLSATTTQLVVEVPSNATTGTVEVTTPNGNAETAGDLTIIVPPSPPVLTSFSPDVAAPGDTVTITGTGFSATAADNQISINGTVAVVASSATTTEIEFVVPEGATSGLMSLTTPTGTVQSAGNLFVPPDPYVASDVDTTVWATLGQAHNITISTANHIGLLVFGGAPGRRVLVSTNHGLGDTEFTLVHPTGGALASDTSGSSPSTNYFFYPDTVAVPTSGQYTVLLDPDGTSTGTLAVTVRDVPPDVTGTATIGGSPVTLSIGTAGQNGRLTFSGTAGQRVSVNVTSVSVAGGADVSILRPDGSGLDYNYAPTFIDPVTLPVTGTYAFLVDPPGLGTGSATVTLYDVEDDVTGSLTVGGASVPVTLVSPGQTGELTFSGTASQQVTVRATSNTIGSVFVRLVRPNGTTQTSTTSASGSFNLTTATLATTGTYSVRVEPVGSNTGSVSIQVTSP